MTRRSRAGWNRSGRTRCARHARAAPLCRAHRSPTRGASRDDVNVRSPRRTSAPRSTSFRSLLLRPIATSLLPTSRLLPGPNERVRRVLSLPLSPRTPTTTSATRSTHCDVYERFVSLLETAPSGSAQPSSSPDLRPSTSSRRSRRQDRAHHRLCQPVVAHPLARTDVDHRVAPGVRWQGFCACGIDESLAARPNLFVSYAVGQVLPTGVGGDASRMFETTRRHPGLCSPIAARSCSSGRSAAP